MDFEKSLKSLINKHGRENASNTPDFILAQYMDACLLAFDTAVQQRENWHGRDPRPTSVKEPVGGESGNGSEISQARATIKAAFDADPHFRRGYVDNVAMCLHDNVPDGMEHGLRNRLADRILDLLFEA